MINIEVIKEDKHHELHVSGEIDAASSIHLDEHLVHSINAGVKLIIVECSNLDYISSAGLGVFMSHLQDLKEKSIKMVIVGLQPKVKNVFSILGLDQLIEIKETKEEVFGVSDE